MGRKIFKREWEEQSSTYPQMLWYTDGSKANKGTGARVCGPGIKYI